MVLDLPTLRCNSSLPPLRDVCAYYQRSHMPGSVSADSDLDFLKLEHKDSMQGDFGSVVSSSSTLAPTHELEDHGGAPIWQALDSSRKSIDEPAKPVKAASAAAGRDTDRLLRAECLHRDSSSLLSFSSASLLDDELRSAESLADIDSDGEADDAIVAQTSDFERYFGSIGSKNDWVSMPTLAAAALDMPATSRPTTKTAVNPSPAVTPVAIVSPVSSLVRASPLVRPLIASCPTLDVHALVPASMSASLHGYNYHRRGSKKSLAALPRPPRQLMPTLSNSLRGSVEPHAGARRSSLKKVGFAV
nr:hypothetical protein HK105_008329 [Polyrhizophydium stewartii]